ncbi:hypothetical protein BD769DRAFT_1641860 [Suillus cothurnatus]|nr:hypothetical protein BD769DRAFT_1641860 [Suillus cothurnatus]
MPPHSFAGTPVLPQFRTYERYDQLKNSPFSGPRRDFIRLLEVLERSIQAILQNLLKPPSQRVEPLDIPDSSHCGARASYEETTSLSWRFGSRPASSKIAARGSWWEWWASWVMGEHGAGLLMTVVFKLLDLLTIEGPPPITKCPDNIDEDAAACVFGGVIQITAIRHQCGTTARLCGDEFEDRGAGLESLSRFKLLNSSDVRGGERNIGCQRRWKYLDSEMVLRQPDIGRGYRRTEHGNVLYDETQIDNDG